MKLFLSLITVTAIISISSFGQVSISTVNLNFGNRTAYQKDSLSVTLTNSSVNPATIGSLSSSDSAFSLRAASTVIPANSSQTVWIRIYSVHNITYNEKVYISIPSTLQTFSVSVSATVNYAESVYNSTQNKFDSALLTALTSIASSGHNALGYDGARNKMFSIIDDYSGNDNIECVYTGRTVVTSSIPSATGSQSMNTEHTWPQSMFGSANPMVSDLHHLFPTDATANSRRSNYPFGIVNGSPTWENAGSKLGTLTTGGTGFEPRDIHKGNVARSMFYFVTRYKGSNANYGGFYSSVQDAVFKKWNKSDPVDAHETTRNNSIESFQGNRNPFVDHPEFADRIHDFINSTNRASSPKFSISSTNLKFGAKPTGQSYSWHVKLANTGTSNLSVASIISDNLKFAVQNIPVSISTGLIDSFKVIYTPTSSVEVPTGKITVSSNAGSYQVNINGPESGDFNNNGSATGQVGGGGGTETGTTNPPTTLSFSSLQPTFLDVSWFEPSGYVTADNDFVVLVSTAAFPSAPSGSITSSVSNVNFSIATQQLNSNGKLVFKGDATSFTLTGLLASTTYYVSVYTVQGTSVYSTSLQSTITTSATSTGGETVEHFTEDFNSLTTSSYESGDKIINSKTWNFTSVYAEDAGASRGGTGKAARINDDIANAQITTPPVNTLGSISFYYRELNTGGGVFTLSKSVDGGNFVEIASQAFSGTVFTYFSFNVNESGSNVKLKIENNNQPGHLIIDDLTLTAFDVPVKLTSFTAASTGSGVKLMWSIATETKNLGFYVEK